MLNQGILECFLELDFYNPIIVVDMVGVGNIKIEARVNSLMMTLWVYHGFKYAWTLEFVYRFGCSLNIKLIKEDLHVCIYVHLFINWGNPFENKVEPSVVLMSLGHHGEYLALTSPVITDK